MLQGVLIYHKYVVVINNIRDMLNENWDMHIEHTLRKGNMCVDLLAKHAAYH